MSEDETGCNNLVSCPQKIDKVVTCKNEGDEKQEARRQGKFRAFL